MAQRYEKYGKLTLTKQQNRLTNSEVSVDFAFIITEGRVLLLFNLKKTNLSVYPQFCLIISKLKRNYP